METALNKTLLLLPDIYLAAGVIGSVVSVLCDIYVAASALRSSSLRWRRLVVAQINVGTIKCNVCKLLQTVFLTLNI